MGFLNKEAILGCNDVAQKVTVAVPEWGGEVLVRPMTGKERDAFEQALTDKKGNLRALVCSYSICDEDGKLLFASSDVERLGGKSAAALQRVFDVAIKLARVTKEDVDELEKNSATTPS